MDDWYEKIVAVRSHWDMWDMFGNRNRHVPTDGDEVVFWRLPGHRSRRRYYVLKGTAGGYYNLTNAVILYQKSRNAWAIFLIPTHGVSRFALQTFNGSYLDPVKRYRTLSAAKMALRTNPLDRVGAETDAICEVTNDSVKS